MIQFKANKNSSVRSAAKALVNFFRDVCPHMLPKKFIGRFTKIDETNNELVYGDRKAATNVDGI